jgi:hypothetical protein
MDLGTDVAYTQVYIVAIDMQRQDWILVAHIYGSSGRDRLVVRPHDLVLGSHIPEPPESNADVVYL